MDKIYTDIAVIGGGAAGLAAAIHCKRMCRGDYSVMLIEQGARVGKKLLATGNGRCNLSHYPLYDENVHYYGEPELALDVFSRAVPTEDFFASLGLRCRTDNEGRTYPYSNAAASVVDALRFGIENEGVILKTEFSTARLESVMEGFIIHPSEPENGIVTARRVILATGGKSQPSTGSDGYGFTMLEKLNIKASPLFPALCPVYTDSKMVRSLKGLRVRANVKAYIDDRLAAEELGEVQFGEDTLSGIAVFNLSRLAFISGGNNNDGRLTFSLDLAPDMDINCLNRFIKNTAKSRQNQPLGDLLSGLLPKRIGEVIIKQSGINSANEAEKLARFIKSWEFPIRRYSRSDIPNALWQSAQITGGGVKMEDLTPSLSSKKHKDLYIIGEAVNVYGDCGGYNLAWAWASAEIAAEDAVNSLKKQGKICLK